MRRRRGLEDGSWQHKHSEFSIKRHEGEVSVKSQMKPPEAGGEREGMGRCRIQLVGRPNSEKHEHELSNWR
jgi:hypothetical protein